MTPQEQLAIMAQIDNGTNNKINEMDRDFLIKQHVTNTIAESEEPEEEEVDKTSNMFLDIIKTDEAIGRGLVVGGVKGINNALLWLTDVTGMKQTNNYLGKADTWIEENFGATSTAGEVAEDIGAFGTGLFLTRGLGSSLQGGARVASEALRGGAIDFLAFKGEEGNVADLLDNVGVKSTLVEYLTTQEEDSETAKRGKNSVTGMGIGVALEALFKFGRVLLKREAKETGKIFTGTEDEVIEHTIDLVKQDAKKVADNPKFKKRMPDVEIPKVPKVDLKQAYVKMADDFIDGKSADIKVDLTSPFNASKIVPKESQEVFAKATEDIEASVSKRTWKETAKLRDEQLKANLDDEAYDMMDDLTRTAEKLENLDVTISKQRVILGSVAQEFSDNLKILQKEGGATARMMALQSLDRLENVGTAIKGSQTNVSRAMNAMKMNTADTAILNQLKLLDSIDSDYSLLKVKNILEKGDEKALAEVWDKIADPLSKLKDKAENYQDGTFTKIGNVLSESVVANMLSSPSTLAVNVIGNSYVKHQKLMEEVAQYTWGFVTGNKNRMKFRELRRLVQANIGHNWGDVKAVTSNLKTWYKSGFKDETFDKGVLARYVQDQAFQHKYISSQYLRGDKIGNQHTAFNSTINTLGKLARAPYRAIGAVDDYYKRGAFKAELIREGSKLADALEITDEAYDGFLDRFIRANTMVHVMRNNGERPTAEFLKRYEDVMPNGLGVYNYADKAVERANYMTFQTELNGVVGKGVDFLNSNGYFRVLVPFKLTPINILKRSGSIMKEALSPIRKQFYKDVFVHGGIKRDIALAKLTASATIVTGIGYLVQSGHMTGTLKPEERRSAQIPELSFKIGNKWYDYRQLEPLATIAGVMTDLFRIQNDARVRFEDIDTEDVNEEIQGILGDLMLSVAQNITNKTYAKSIAEITDFMFGDKSIVDYSGNLISSAMPYSSLANFGGRVFGEPVKYEAKTFTEKIFSKYKNTLERKALDAFGRYIPETEYTPFLTKSYKPRENNEGAMEVGRLGIRLPKMKDSISYSTRGISVDIKLEPEEYWKMRRNMDSIFGLSNKLNIAVKSDSYKNASDIVKTMVLKNIIRKARSFASKSIMAEERIIKEIKRKMKNQAVKVKDTEIKATYNNMIYDLIGGN